MAKLSDGQDSTSARTRRLIRDTPVKLKMTAAFLVVGLIGCAAAGIGIRHIGLIADQVEGSTQIAIPLSEGAAQLGTTVREAQVLALTALQSQDYERIAELSKAVDAQEKLFLENSQRIEELAVRKGIVFRTPEDKKVSSEKKQPDSSTESLGKKELTLTQITADRYKGLIAEIREMLEAHVSNLKAHALARKRLEEFRSQAELLRSSARTIEQMCERSFAANEESAKTRVQTSKATVQELSEIIERFFDQDYPLASGAQELRKSILEAEQAATEFLSENDEKRLEQIQITFEKQMKESLLLARRLKGRTNSPEIKQAVGTIHGELERLKEIVQAQDGIFTVHRASLKSKAEEQTMLEKVDISAGTCKSTIKIMTSEAQETAARALAKSAQTASSGLSSLIGMAAVGLVASVLIGVSLAFALLRPLTTLATQADLVSKGDLTVNIGNHHRADELGSLGNALALMVTSLKDHVFHMNDGIKIISSTASEIAANVTHVAQTISEATSSLKELSVTAEELKHTATVSNDTARRVAVNAKETVEVSQAGLDATQTTLSRMKQIESQMGAIGNNVVNLSAQSQAIEAITASVRDIADQSNLLAVNASIEAARAGDRGKGFGVVATEIKELADASRKAADRIMDLLQETRKWVSATVMATEQGNKAVEAGLEQSVVTEEAIKRLSQTVEGSAEASTVIEASSVQQLEGTKQIFEALAGIEQAMRHTLDGSEQLREEVQRLNALAAQLREMTARFSA